jgi:hypothetical protein
VHASAEHVVSLLVNETATAEDGARLAREWLEQSEQRYLGALDSTSTDDQLHELLDVLRAFRTDPRRLAQLLGYAERLLEERSVRRGGRPKKVEEPPAPAKRRGGRPRKVTA